LANFENQHDDSINTCISIMYWHSYLLARAKPTIHHS